MIDENAYGFLISYFTVEDDEYSMDQETFVARFEGFRDAVIEYVSEHPPGADARALSFGHAVYLEVAQGDEIERPIAWLKDLRGRLAASDYDTVGVLSHGSRWVEEDRPSELDRRRVGAVDWVDLTNPSEPLRRAGYADAACQGDAEAPGWGAGLYLDTEAVEALGKTPKNAPTVLDAGGATFFRAGS